MTPEIKDYLEEHEATIAPLHKDYCKKFWNLSVAGKEEDAEALVNAKERFLKVYSNPEEFRKVQDWYNTATGPKPREPGGRDTGAATRDPRLAALDSGPQSRQLKLIYFSFIPHQMDEKTLREIVERETRIENRFNTFRPEFEGGHASENQLRDILKHEPDISRRRAAWEASKQIGAEVAEQVIELVEIRNREAQRLGFQDYYAMMLELQELDERWLFRLLDDLERLSEQPYAAMKRELDAELKQRYGLTGPESYPWLYGDPFFQDYQSAGAGDVLDEIFKDKNIEAVTREHYRLLGLDVDELLDRADLYEREGKSQHAFCLDVDREGDVRVLCNLRRNEQSMSTMLHEFGHAVYDKYNDSSLPFMLRTPAHILTTEAVAMLNGRMTKDPPWLRQVAGLPQDQAQSIGSRAFTVLRSGILIFLRWAITLIRFERELYGNPRQPLNELWWDYAERLQKVTPPPGRNRPDWASKNHIATSPVYYQNYILGELMASQVSRYVQRVVLASDTLVGRAEAGQYLVDRIFKPGARNDWSTMLKNATGEQLNPEHFIRQFNLLAH